MPQEEGQWQAKARDESAEQPVTQPLFASNEPVDVDVRPLVELQYNFSG